MPSSSVTCSNVCPLYTRSKLSVRSGTGRPWSGTGSEPGHDGYRHVLVRFAQVDLVAVLGREVDDHELVEPVGPAHRHQRTDFVAEVRTAQVEDASRRRERADEAAPAGVQRRAEPGESEVGVLAAAPQPVEEGPVIEPAGGEVLGDRGQPDGVGLATQQHRVAQPDRGVRRKLGVVRAEVGEEGVGVDAAASESPHQSRRAPLSVGGRSRDDQNERSTSASGVSSSTVDGVGSAHRAPDPSAQLVSLVQHSGHPANLANTLRSEHHRPWPRQRASLPSVTVTAGHRGRSVTDPSGDPIAQPPAWRVAAAKRARASASAARSSGSAAGGQPGERGPPLRHDPLGHRRVGALEPAEVAGRAARAGARPRCSGRRRPAAARPWPTG